MERIYTTSQLLGNLISRTNGRGRPLPLNININMKYFVESNNGIAAFGVIKEFTNYKEAKEYADNYSKAYGVKTIVTSN